MKKLSIALAAAAVSVGSVLPVMAEATVMQFFADFTYVPDRGSAFTTLRLIGTFDSDKVVHQSIEAPEHPTVKTTAVAVHFSDAIFYDGATESGPTALDYQTGNLVLRESELGGSSLGFNLDGLFRSSASFRAPSNAQAFFGASPLTYSVKTNVGVVNQINVDFACTGCTPVRNTDQYLYSGSITNASFELSVYRPTDLPPVEPVPDDEPTAAVPEPATWAMMLVGFGMVGGASRVRKKAASVGVA